MTQLNAATISAFLMTAIVLFLLGYVPYIPAWAVFITWACFFHMDGGVDRNQAYVATVVHMGLGALAAWISALMILENPFGSAVAQQVWAPMLIGIVIAVLIRVSAIPRLSVTPVTIYGYASIFAFVSASGSFSLENLLSVTTDNALVTILISIVVGASAGYLNAVIVSLLCSDRWVRRSEMSTVPEDQ